MNTKRRILLNGVLFLLAVFAGLLITIPIIAKASGVSGVEDDRVYFFALSGDPEQAGDCFLIQSNGHFGLIDTSNRSVDTITDENGDEHILNIAENLWNPEHNGLKNAKYMIETLGVTHLDFIVGTHAHSDHIGGAPEIASLEYNGVKLVDSNTVYLFKEYKSVNYLDDDDWMNGIFSYQAVHSMEEAGACVVNLSQGYYTNEIETGTVPDQEANLQIINGVQGLSDAVYRSGEPENAYDDLISFQIGDFTISLYNLYSTPTYLNENVNSICTLIQKGSQSIVLLADINDEQQVAQKVARSISGDLGGARVSLLKDGHHATPRGSNTKEEADLYRPEQDISTKLWTESTVNNNFANFKYYCETHFGTVFYSTGDAEEALVASVSEDEIEIDQLTGSGADASLTAPVINTRTTWDGWHVWDYEYDWYGYDKNGLVWTYFENGIPKTGWQEIGGSRYYFDNNGFMQNGWLKYGSDWYYLNGSGRMYTGWLNLGGGLNSWYYLDDNGIMATGWRTIEEKTYFFDFSGAMQTGWKTISGKKYFFDDSGVLVSEGWAKSDGSWIYLDEKGELVTEWLKDGGYWYYLDPENGRIMTGWQEIDGERYFFETSGKMCTNRWMSDNGSWYYLNSSGMAAKNTWLAYGGSWYYLDDTGEMAVGWKQLGNNWYYFATSGKMTVGWKWSGKVWYYFETSGKMAVGWKKIGSAWYCFDSSGAMAVGWKPIGNAWYYFHSNGSMASNEWVPGYYWISASGKWTYPPAGQWKKDAKGWWFTDSSGWYAKNTAIKIDGTYYRFDANGYWVK